MGEYAERRSDGERVKIGTCENMYYLRADQVRAVRALDGNVDPVGDAVEIRFRFPWPDEDHVLPGEHEASDRGLLVEGLRAPEGAEHGTLWYASRGHRGEALCGGGRGVELVQQRLVGFDLVAVGRCPLCRTRWRYSDAPSALPLMMALAERGRREADPSLLRIASRVLDGYSGRHPFAPGMPLFRYPDDDQLYLERLAGQLAALPLPRVEARS